MEGLFKSKYRILSTRLSGYDYQSSGFYFVTICTYNRVKYFGDVLRDDGGGWSMALSDAGEIARDYWLDIPNHAPNASLDEWVIMPNHVHGVIVINQNDNQCNDFVETQHAASLQGGGPSRTFYRLKPKSLSTIVRSFKSAVANCCHKQNFNFHWQSRFWDHIIRTESALQNIRAYIKNNPQMWHRDRNNSDGLLR